MNQTEKAELARQVLENPIFRVAIQEMRDAFVEAWLSTPENGQETRDLAWRHVKFLGVFQDTLEGYITRALPRKLDLP